MRYVFAMIIASIILIGCSAQRVGEEVEYAIANPESLSMKLVGGRWLEGDRMVKKTVWIKDGILHFEEVREVDTTIDLSNQYVIPPFAEAHNHNLESAYELEKRIDHYLDHGVFYVKLLSSIKKRIDPLMHHYNKPDGIDVQMAHAPFTATGGHPISLRQRYLDSGYFTGLFENIEEVEFHGYVIIDNKKDLVGKWDSLMSFQPDFIKLNLLHSEEYETRKDDTAYFGQKGLNH